MDSTIIKVDATQNLSKVNSNMIPFNISLLNLSAAQIARMRPVKSLDMFDGATKNFHPDGLYSNETFGIAGSEARSVKFGYINCKLDILHPIIYKSLTDMRALYREILAGRQFAKWDPDLMDFMASDIVDGQTGYEYFMSYYKKIKIEKNSSLKREQAIRLLDDFREDAIVKRIPVLPAGLRDIEIDDSGRATSDEINELYWKMIAISNTINEASVDISPEAYNTQRVSLQNHMNAIYDYLLGLIQGKKNLVTGKWAGRKVFNGTRNVIVSMDASSDDLDAEGGVTFNDTFMGIYQACKAILPITQYHLRTGFLSEVFSSKGAPALLTNMQTMKSERVDIPAVIYDAWMSNEGLEKFITNFQEDSVRHAPIVVMPGTGTTYCLGMTYRGPDGTFKLIHGIDELPVGRLPEDCTFLSAAELLYTQIYHVANKYVSFITRYPVTGVGSIYPSNVYLKSTVKYEVREELDESWMPLGKERISYQFPVVGSKFFAALAPHPSRLKKMGGDFDGDTCSATVAYSDEALQEVKEFYQSKLAYVGTNGMFINDCNHDTVRFVLQGMTGF